MVSPALLVLRSDSFGDFIRGAIRKTLAPCGVGCRFKKKCASSKIKKIATYVLRIRNELYPLLSVYQFNYCKSITGKSNELRWWYARPLYIAFLQLATAVLVISRFWRAIPFDKHNHVCLCMVIFATFNATLLRCYSCLDFHGAIKIADAERWSRS